MTKDDKRTVPLSPWKGATMDKEKGKSGIVKWIIIAMVIIAAIVAGILIFLNSQKLSATTMRLLKIQGIVKLFDKDKDYLISRQIFTRMR